MERDFLSFCLPEGIRSSLDSFVNISLVSLLHLSDHLTRGGVEGGEGLARHTVVPLIVNEDPGVLK